MIEPRNHNGPDERFQPHWINYIWHMPLQTMNFLSNFYSFIRKKMCWGQLIVQSSGPIYVNLGLCALQTNILLFISFFQERIATSYISPIHPAWCCSRFVGFSTGQPQLINWCILMIIQSHLYCIVRFSFQLQQQQWRSINSLTVNIHCKPTALAELGD